MAATNVQAFSGDVELNDRFTIKSTQSNITKKSFTAYNNNGTDRYWKVVSGSYSGNVKNQISMTVKINRVDYPFITRRLIMEAHDGDITYNPTIDEHDSPSPSYPRDLRVYKNTTDSTFDIYIQVNSYGNVDVDMTYSGSNITVYDTPTWEASEPTTSGTYILDFTNGNKNTIKIKENGYVGIGTTNPQNSLHLFKASDDQTRGLFIEKQTGASGTAQITFGVNNSDENTGVAKAGIFFERTALNGLGSLKFAVDTNSDGNDVGVSDSLITLKNNYYVGFGPNLDPEQLFHFVRNTEDDHVYIKFGKSRNNITSQQYWKPYMYAAANSTNTQYAYTTYYSNGFFIGVDEMEAGWGSNYYGGNMDIRAGNVYSPGNNGSALSTNYNGGNIILQAGITRTGGASSQSSRTYGGSILFKAQSTDTYANTDANAYERMRVDGPTGRVGISTSSPEGTLHVEANDRVHFTKSIAAFTGLEVTTSRSQLVLTSNYSDLVLASRVSNNTHGSTVTFAAVDPNNGGNYRKFVINQGAWGGRSNMLSFGYADGSYTNPHSVINGTYTTMTIDGYSRRVGIANESPSYNLDVGGKIRATSRILADDGVDLNANYGYVALLPGTGDGDGHPVYNTRYRTWWSIAITDYQNVKRMWFDARGGYIYAGTFAPTSDDRIKINETRIKSALSTIKKLDPQVYDKAAISDVFDVNDPDKANFKREAGFMAQDIWYDIPELRHAVRVPASACPDEDRGTPNPDPRIDPDYSGWGPDVAAVNYNSILPYTVKAIQEMDVELTRIKARITDIDLPETTKYHGMVVSANTNTHQDEIPVLSLSKKEYDKACYGIISSKETHSENNEVLVDKYGNGQIWIINTSNLESGDLLTTSNVNGFSMKQNDDIIRNYTIAKINQDCDFNPKLIPIKRKVQQLTDVTYYEKEEYQDLPTDEIHLNAIRPHKIKEIDETVYKSTAYVLANDSDEEHTENLWIHSETNDLISNDTYDSLPDDEKLLYEQTTGYKKYTYVVDIAEQNPNKYTKTTRRVKKLINFLTSPDPIPGYTTKTKQEMRDVLDENGQFTWEETEQTEYEYPMKFIDAGGLETDEISGVYRAALVSCTILG